MWKNLLFNKNKTKMGNMKIRKNKVILLVNHGSLILFNKNVFQRHKIKIFK